MSMPRLACPSSVPLIDRHVDGAQLRSFLVWIGIRGKHTGAELAASEVLESTAHPVRWIELGVKVRFGVWRAVGRRLMKYHHVRKRPLPQAVIFQKHGLERAGEVAPDLSGEVGKR